jgi:signal peptidase II
MRLVFWAGFWAFITDQASKFLVLNALNLREVMHIEVLPPFLQFHMAWNRGVNFGLFSDTPEAVKWVLIGLALVICGFVLHWVRREPPGKWGMISAGLLIGGALGNVIDRLLFGAVVDFLNMSCCGIKNPYAFNLADVWIFAGAIGLVVFGGKKTEA